VIDTTRLAQAEAHGAETGQLESTLELDDMDTESVDSSSSSPSEFALARSPRARALALLHAFFDVGNVGDVVGVCVCVCVYVCGLECTYIYIYTYICVCVCMCVTCIYFVVRVTR
jgi:hypothetical protein